jgi:hypothetical protein
LKCFSALEGELYVLAEGDPVLDTGLESEGVPDSVVGVVEEQSEDAAEEVGVRGRHHCRSSWSLDSVRTNVVFTEISHKSFPTGNFVTIGEG